MKTIKWYVVKRDNKLVGIYTYSEVVDLCLAVVNTNVVFAVKTIECEV